MPWYAKPGFTGNGYDIDSVEAATNAFAISDYFRNIWNYTLEATVGIVANAFGESGLNPWIYEADPDQPGIINPNLGYGLFQFTPMSQYLLCNGYARTIWPELQHYTNNTGGETTQLWWCELWLY